MNRGTEMIGLMERVTTANTLQMPFDGMRGPTLVVAGADGRLAVERLQLVRPPLLVDMPLADGVVNTAASHCASPRIALHRNHANEHDSVAVIELTETLRRTYPVFPDHDSVVAHGWFTPTDGRPARRFIAYIDPGFEARIALPDDAASRAAAPRGRAAREAAGRRAAAALLRLERASA